VAFHVNLFTFISIVVRQFGDGASILPPNIKIVTSAFGSTARLTPAMCYV
jgi:hypothetical protein